MSERDYKDKLEELITQASKPEAFVGLVVWHMDDATMIRITVQTSGHTIALDAEYPNLGDENMICLPPPSLRWESRRALAG